MDNLQYTTTKKRIELEKRHFPKGVAIEMICLLDEVELLLSKAYQSGYQVAERMVSQEWNNNSCLGYAVLAAEMMGLDETFTSKLVRSMNNRFDSKTLEEANQAYCNSDY
ncbi:hypothetical protein ACP8HI_13600 [Paenibacillus sp. FA6]|uniref:hypothetical protein n=1 Tax=Paenibacillus sp. FA6 TaxID=3413029 RepID=UPI003F65D33C